VADKIEFDAQVGSWTCIKKQKIETDMSKVEASRILASIHDSMDRKIWDFLKEEFPLAEFDKIIYEMTGAVYNEKKKEWLVEGRKTEQQIAETLSKLNSSSTTQKINQLLNPKTKNGLEIAKAYITRKTLDLLGFRLELDPKIAEKYVEEKSKLI
jgi:hypothetical protein